MAYTDELEPLATREQELRRTIALRLAEEAGQSPGDGLSQAQLAAADEAIEAWQSEGEEEADLRAFRPVGPLQELLANHQAISERIADILDRRLS